MLAWVSWVPWNLLFFEQWVQEPIKFGKKGPKFSPFLVQNKQEIGVWIQDLESAFAEAPLGYQSTGSAIVDTVINLPIFAGFI